jgi:ATP-binding cassette subfamily B (MDR/TAP) protein 1
MSSERQTRMIRKKLFAAILKQEIKWFDNHSSGELTTKLTNDIDRIKEAIGLKFSNAIQLFSTFIRFTAYL